MGNDVTLVFVGRLGVASFTEFVIHRARRLALEHVFGSIEPGRVEVTVTGHADLIDAFELACSLGPIDCLVTETFRTGGRPAAFGPPSAW